MKIPKKAYGTPAPSFTPEQGFYTEADIRMIVKEAVQEVIAAWMTASDEEAEEIPETGHLGGGKLTLSVQEAADLLGVSKPKMFEILHSGGISYKKFGKKILISYQGLVDWINK